MYHGLKPNAFVKFYAIMFQETDSYNDEVAVYKLLQLLSKLDIIQKS